MKITINYFAQSIYFLSLLNQYRYQLFNSIFSLEMKGILKIYHPDETLKYHIHSTYCKAVYSNTQHFLEVEIITDDSLDHVDDDSLQYHFPQISMNLSDFPIEDAELMGKTFEINDVEADNLIDVDLFNNDDVYLTGSKLSFKNNTDHELELFWEGSITDFFTDSDQVIPFKLKCNFKQDEIVVDED
ncbi:hypothetical protein [Kaistella yonginensis]|uniref:hypothetical protein n=1 Tax=Kaistella yonginensis TaxID=658267 RepID=UPI003F497461